MHDLQVKLAGPNDASAITAVLLEAFIEFKPLYTNRGFAATTPDAQEVLVRLEEGPVWVAVSDDEIVGTASAVLKSESLYVRGMAVLPAKRGRRIGESLLEQIESYANEYDCRRLFLSTTPFLDRAIRLYERFGFRRTEQGPSDLFGTPLFTMEKLIK